MAFDPIESEASFHPAGTSRARSLPLGAWAVLGAALLVLLAHIARYWFLTDDAYISFRYARNLADGDGLVFNPGYERVEGYTNFLWVLMLAGLNVLGLRPEWTANVLSITCGLLLWVMVARFAFRERRADRPVAFALIAPILLAFTRSYAVWCTSGLETKLFELLVIGATLRAVTEIRLAHEGRRSAPISALLFALGTLTRPDALLIAFCVLAMQTMLLWRAGKFRVSRTAVAFFTYVVVVGAHVLWRRWYYDDWVPNTFYAKTGGGSWWYLGVRYVALWIVEYAAVLWTPLIVVAIIDRIRSRRAEIPLIFTAAIVPHVFYIMSIGGDHFEYRPLDAYFPLIYLLLGDGTAAIAATARRARLAVAYLCVVLAGVVALPEVTHHAYPDRYIVGFPGDQGRTPGDHRFVTTETNPVLMRVPLVRQYIELFNHLIRINTAHFAAIRQEEHAFFLATVIPEGRTLARLVREGRLPADLHVAIDSIGAIPYYSDLRTLDRLGLTDRHVAKYGIRLKDHARLIAHEVYPTLDYGASVGVDVWAAHAVHLLHNATNIDLFEAVVLGQWKFQKMAARVDEDHLLVGLFPDKGRPTPRAAKLDWIPLAELTQDRDYVRHVTDELARRLEQERDDPRLFHLHGIASAELGDVQTAERSLRAAIELDPNAPEAIYDLGSIYLMAGRADLAIEMFRRADRLGEPKAEAYNELGRAHAQLGEAGEAIAAFQKAIELKPDYADAHGNLANMLGTMGRVAEARQHYGTAIRLAPRAPLNYQNLSIVLERAGDEGGAVDALRRGVTSCPNAPPLLARLAFLLATSPDDNVRDPALALELAQRAVVQTDRQDAQSLEALAAALAAAGRFDEATRIANDAIAVCNATDNTSLADRLRRQVALYAARTPFLR